MTERDPRRRLAAARARAEAATAQRAAAARAARVADVRARLALAEAARAARPVVGSDVYTRPPTPPTLAARAARERAVPGIVAAAAHLAAERHADALAAIPESHTAYDWSPAHEPPHRRR